MLVYYRAFIRNVNSSRRLIRISEAFLSLFWHISNCCCYIT